MDKKFYKIIYDCIVSGQVSSDRIAKYLKDKEQQIQKNRENIIKNIEQQIQRN